MTAIVAPPIPASGWRGAIVDRHDLGGETLFAVTIRHRYGKARRDWFRDRGEAMAHALNQSDYHGLPLIDLSESEPE